jgi:hypothetical protein
MQRDDVRELLAEGMNVYGADGGKVGSIVTLNPRAFVVEKGFFFPTDYAIPLAAVGRVDADGVWLTVSKEDAFRQQWDVASLEAEHDGALIAPVASRLEDRALEDRLVPPTAEGGGTTAEAGEPIRRYSTDNTQDAMPSA